MIENTLQNISALGEIAARALRDGDLDTATACSQAVVKLNEQLDALRVELTLQPQAVAA